MSYIIAHRANGSKYKENTKEAVLEVLSYDYVDGIEIDIRLTKDKKFVVSHNSLVLCEKVGIRRISKEKYSHLKICKKIELLEEILKEIQTKKYIFLDLKFANESFKDWKKLIKLLKRYPLNYYLVSFSYSFLLHLKKLYPTYSMGYLKGYLMNLDKKKAVLDGCFAYLYIYTEEEGIWTVNTKEEMRKYKEKDIFIITDKPKYVLSTV